MLTSNVFGVYRYTPFEYGLKPFLRSVVSWQGEQQKPERQELLCLLDEVNDFEILFWPRMDDRTEPDVVILLKDADSNSIGVVGIEAKHGASMQSYSAESADQGAGTDEGPEETEGDEGTQEADEDRRATKQVAKYLGDLRQTNAPFLQEVGCSQDRIFLIYLTHHVFCPRESLRDALAHCEYGDNCFWSSWRHVYRGIAKLLGHPDKSVDARSERMLKDLKRLLTGIGYATFEGMHVSSPPELNWHYPAVPLSERFTGWDSAQVAAPKVTWNYPFHD